jgi:hypothetical protein
MHADGDSTTLTSLQPLPLRHQDVLTIGGSCFTFSRVGIDDLLAL